MRNELVTIKTQNELTNLVINGIIPFNNWRELFDTNLLNNITVIIAQHHNIMVWNNVARGRLYHQFTSTKTNYYCNINL